MLIDEGLYERAIAVLTSNLQTLKDQYDYSHNPTACFTSTYALKECLDYSNNQAYCHGTTSLFMYKHTIKIPQHLMVDARSHEGNATITSELSFTDLSFIIMFIHIVNGYAGFRFMIILYGLMDMTSIHSFSSIPR